MTAGNKIKLFIFDLGNVILKFDHGIAVKKIAGLLGLPERRIHESIFPSGVERLFDSGKIGPKEFFSRISAGFAKPATFQDFKNAWADIFKSNPGMNLLLRRLKPRFKICLLSNTNGIHFSFARNKFHILNVFDEYFLSYKLRFCKPDKRIFNEVLRKYKIKAGECVYIDDINEYVRAAKKMGFFAIRYKDIKSLKISFKKLGIKI